ncbi:uncharacterized protein [Typha latifolia]|uniref:uncharacterized protein n=1 Tax=Typha latifolia TaxID=4733 RepID=UPI003C309116
MATDKSGEPIMMIKMDMENAYDRVGWPSGGRALRRMGFPLRWCNWVQACIASPRRPKAFSRIQSQRSAADSPAIRGRPAADAGSHAYKRPQRSRESLSQDESLTHQRVNYSKSELYLPSRVGAEAGSNLSAQLGLKVAGMPFKYLGVLISGRRVKVQEQQELVERISKRLAGWKGTILSQAGKLTLIKAALLAIPSYWLGSTWVPNGVLEEIEKKARNFLWKNPEGRGLH